MTEPPAPDRFSRIEALFEAALGVPPGDQAAFLKERCPDDPALRREVADLLAEDARPQPGLDGEGLGAELRVPLEPLGVVAARAELPARIGPFRVLGRLGSGGMGTVYLAQQDEPRRRVAVKVLHPGLASARHRRRFRREARLLARLRHPGIAQVYESGVVGGQDGQPYLAMELVEGLPLTEFARRHGLDVTRRVRLVAGLCDAVQHAHERGVIHRDLKPDNVLVVAGAGTGGEPLCKVLDFGIARAADPASTLASFQTTQGQVLGTLAFMSPEQAASGAVDRRTDVYSLGAILFHLLSGALPHDIAGHSLPAALRTIQETDATRLASVDTRLRGDLDTICARALESEPERRYGSAAELAADLRRFLAHEPIAARAPSTAYRLRKFARRNRALVGGVVSTLVVLLIGTVVSTGLAIRASRSARAASASETLALRELYRASLRAAQRQAREDPLAAQRELARAPERFRGWEWDYLASQVHAGEERYAFGHDVDEQRTDLACGAGERWLLATASPEEPRRIDLIDAGSGQGFPPLLAPGPPTELEFSRDGRRLAVLTHDPARVVLWDVTRPERPSALFERPVPEPSTSLALSPSGAHVALWGRPRSDAPGAEPRALLLAGDSGEVLWESVQNFIGLAVAETADGWKLAGWRGELERPDSKAEPWGGWFVREGDQEIGRSTASFVDLCTSLDASGTRIAITQTRDFIGRLNLLDGATLEPLVPALRFAQALSGCAFSPDGARLALRGTAGGVYLVEASSGATLGAFPERVLDLAFDPGGQHLAGLTPSGVRLWDLARSPARVLDAQAGYLYHAVFSPDGRWLATGGVDPEVHVWDAGTGEAVARFSFPGGGHVKGLSFSADGTRLIGVRGDVQQRHTRAWTLAPEAGAGVELPAVVDGSGPEWTRLGYWDAARGGARFSLGRSINDLATSASGDVILAGIPGGFFLADRAQAVPPGIVPSQRVSVALSPDGSLVATGEGLEVRLWDRATHARRATLTGHRGEVLGVEFHPDGTRLASCGRDRTIRIWDVETHQELLVLEGHTDYVHAVSFSPDGTWLASASGDGTARLWEARTPAKRVGADLGD